MTMAGSKRKATKQGGEGPDAKKGRNDDGATTHDSMGVTAMPPDRRNQLQREIDAATQKRAGQGTVTNPTDLTPRPKNPPPSENPLENEHETPSNLESPTSTNPSTDLAFKNDVTSPNSCVIGSPPKVANIGKRRNHDIFTVNLKEIVICVEVGGLDPKVLDSLL